MAQKIEPNNEAMKQALKEALTETLHEQRGLLHEVFTEVLEDLAFAEAIREGKQTEQVGRDEVFAKSFGAARGMWKERDELPDLRTLRQEFDDRSASDLETDRASSRDGK